MHFLPMSKEVLNSLNRQGYASTVLPAGSYNNSVIEDIQTCGAPGVILVQSDMDDDVVYAMTKAICESKEMLVQYYTGFIYYFVIFGAFFSALGGGEVLIDLGMKISAKSHGGPAKASIISSGLLGMVNGSAVANVSTTGVMTIPLMKQAGYTPEEAGAVEAVASTGGQIMPPIMGVGAFIMAEMIGIPYGKIAFSAIIPALAYYGSIFLLVDFLARKRKLEAGSFSYQSQPILKRLYLLSPMIAVVICIAMGYSLMRSAIIGIGAVLIINIARGKNGIGYKEVFEASTEINVSHGYSHVVRYHCPVEVLGLTVKPGDLMMLDPCQKAIAQGRKPTLDEIRSWRTQMTAKRDNS